MWPLLIFSIAVLSITLERIIFLSYHNLKTDDLKNKINEAYSLGNFKEITEYLDSLGKRKIGARVLSVILKNRNLGEQRIEKTAEAEAIKCINSLENGFNVLTSLGSISPLTGFLVTVTGMIDAFRSIAEAENISAQIVASGIYEALITTVFGLIIAIVAMVSHSYLSNRVDKFSSELEEYSNELINKIITHENN